MVSVKRRKAPVASALIAGMHKKAPATAAFVVRTTATFAQSSGTDSGTSSSTSISTTTSTSSCKSSSASGGGLLEKFGSPEIPLRLILVGHNPSAAAWRDGHYYSNPSNRMWRLLSGAGIIPANYTALDDDKCPATCGIGFTDLGHGIPGTDSSQFRPKVLHMWRESLYQRLRGHSDRAGAPPKIVAFTGKRQFKELFYDSPAYKKKGLISYGLQTMRPEGFPFTVEETQLFVLTSSSGAAAMSNEAREAPYKELAVLLQQFPWGAPPPTKTTRGRNLK
ncbi:hypothetical protein VYU27_000274 [Nannochloropsis oceanica]